MTIQPNSQSLAEIGAVSFDLSDWSQVEMSGDQARSFLHNFCTNDIKKLSSGESCEAFICDIKGRILGHVLVLAIQDRLRLIAVPGSASTLVSHLTKYLLDAPVTITDRSAELGLLCLHGAGIQAVLETAFGKPVDLRVGRCELFASEAGELLLAGTDMLPEPAILISGGRDAVAALRERIPAEFLALGTSTLFDILRIEAGFPWYGRDLSAEDLAQTAARTTQAISFTKGCYLGQEPIARLDAMGHTNRELRGMLIQGDEVSVGAAVMAAEKEVGRITSADYSPTRSATVALAMIRTQHAAPGTALTVRTTETDLPATIFWPHLPAN
ncbi:YgfZ/GcvT domain-containing protein [Planctomicrobium sp. SH661]|uniref:CAF17-like 4Fe-4S cluster assembly/insertion protein YgfZ n=1 Tax=Planctomicrobium sp. SH661 TaxID=3448124 RepID=UPI003F5C4322